MTEDSKSLRAAELGMKVTTGAAAAAVSLAGPAGAVAGAIGKELVDAAGTRLFEMIRQRREDRAVQVLAIGAAEAQASIDRFSETIESSPELLSLLAATVQAAMETPLEAKIRALGRCLGRGVKDDTRVDAETLRVRGLARIDVPEAKLMELLAEQPGWMPMDPQSGVTSPTRWLGWRRDEILDNLPGFANVLDASISRLVAEGLALDAGVGTWGGGGPGREQWKLTAFGLDCLRLLNANRS
ncbi:hypothetical protein [Streptacidiphilus sp. EB129]|uniref:hypothetical protein n=1 Tax=Streptacidiphilus sp. EB129 TaxID=3156262 RepID=UPI0035198E06